MKKFRRGLVVATLLVAGALVSQRAAAAPTAYQFVVTGVTGPLAGVTSVGTFTFDPAIVPEGEGYVFVADAFASLSFTWEGVDYDETTANTGDLGFAANGTLFHAMFGTDCGPSGFGCGVGAERPLGWMIAFDNGTGAFTYTSATDPIEIFDGIVTLTPLSIPTTRRQCMKGGWQAFQGPDGPFRNQGDCIRFVNTGK